MFDEKEKNDLKLLVEIAEKKRWKNQCDDGFKLFCGSSV